MATKAALLNQIERGHIEETGWNGLYRLGAVAALLMVALVLLDITVSMIAPGEDSAPGVLTAVDWFEVFQDSPWRGLRDLGFLNILNSILGIPTFFALCMLHRDRQPAYAYFAFILFLFGSAIYISNNTVLPLLTLSREYAQAATEAERSSLIAAGEAMLARGGDFTPGTLVGFVLPSLANMTMAYVVLRGQVFSRAAGYAGLVGFLCLLIFTVWTTFFPESFNTAMLLAMPGGLLVLAWNLMIARGLFQQATAE